MKFIKTTALLIMVSSLLLAGCAATNQISTPDLQTLVAQTVEVMTTKAALQPTQTMVVPTVLPTELLPTFTSIPVLEATATSIPPTPTQTASLVVGSVEDLSSTGTLKGGETFVKTWRITNGGSAAWTTGYRIVFLNGENMGVSTISLGKVINPGSSFTISATFTAPIKSGSHSASFMMETESGYKFGLGAKSGTPWSFTIKVENVFSVTAAVVVPDPASYTGTCPAAISLVPKITVNGSGAVTYYFHTSSGNSDTYSLTFTGSGTVKGNKISWPIDSSMTSLTVNIYIDSPNHQNFNTVTIPITCTP
jgi:hypothetical protein